MPQKTDESLRLTREQSLTAPLDDFRAASVVDARYRLQPADLPAPLVRVGIRAVTIQGMEAPAVLLHLAGFAKPLMLDSQNREALLSLTGTPIFDNWVGRELELHVVGAPGAPRIVLAPVGTPASQSTPPPTERSSARSRVTTVLIVLLVVLVALAAVYWIERGGFAP